MRELGREVRSPHQVATETFREGEGVQREERRAMVQVAEVGQRSGLEGPDLLDDEGRKITLKKKREDLSDWLTREASWPTGRRVGKRIAIEVTAGVKRVAAVEEAGIHRKRMRDSGGWEPAADADHRIKLLVWCVG